MAKGGKSNLPLVRTGLIELPPEAYTAETAREHLHDELGRIDWLVKARTIAWQSTIAADKPEEQWGMVNVSDEEVDRFLQFPYRAPTDLPPDIREKMKPFLVNARAARLRIDGNLLLTPQNVRGNLVLEKMRRVHDLNDYALDLLLACFLSEQQDRYRRLYGHVMDDASRLLPTAGLLLDIAELGRLGPEPAAPEESDDAWDIPRLVDEMLLAWSDEHQANLPLRSRGVRLDELIARLLLDEVASDHAADSERPDSPLHGVLTFLPTLRTFEELPLEKPQQDRLRKLAEWWQSTLPGADNSEQDKPDPDNPIHGPELIVLLPGQRGADRQVAEAFADFLNKRLLQVNVPAALCSSVAWPRLVRLCYREAAYADAFVFWDRAEKLLEPEQPPQRWEDVVAQAGIYRGISFVSSASFWEPGGEFRTLPLVRLELAPPGLHLRAGIWETVLNEWQSGPAASLNIPQTAQALAAGYQLDEEQIRDATFSALRRAMLRDPPRPRLELEDLRDACRRQTGQRLRALAVRFEPADECPTVAESDNTDADQKKDAKPLRGLERLVLPVASRRRLQDLSDRLLYRDRVLGELGFDRQGRYGQGLVALFVGPSGTGKTMAATCLAGLHGVDLYKVDLSAVVSKWVGDTEKNLGRIFDEAEGSNAMILFDEADGLFSKRGEVRDARDRWANLETNYLLQRIETYPGAVILTTNLRRNIDDAFQRRIHIVVEFPFPDPTARAEIFRRLFVGDLKWPKQQVPVLASQFQLSGANIRNVVVDAAFRAVARVGHGGGSVQVELRDVIIAIGREYEKLGKPVSENEFGPMFYGWWLEEIGAAPALLPVSA